MERGIMLSNKVSFSESVRGVLAEVLEERKKQNRKWGEQNHHPFAWLAILGEEVGEANKAALETHFKYPGADADFSNYREELIQCAAVAVAMVESLDRNQNKPVDPEAIFHGATL
jgi:NTP pyrophosphatase (non-canonical NTP hydrolase)